MFPFSARIQGEKITYSNCKRWAEVPGVPVTSTTEPPPVTVRTEDTLYI